MKKSLFLRVLSGLVLIALMVSACAPVTPQVIEKEVTPAPQKEVTKPTLYISTWAWPSMRTVQHRLFQEYTNAKGTQVFYIEFAGGGFDYNRWIEAQAAVNELPDLVMGRVGAIDEDVRNGRGHFLDLSPYLDKPNPYAPEFPTWRDVFVNGVLDEAAVAGPDGKKQYVYIPLDRATDVLYIWDEPFKKAGFTLPIEDYPTFVKALDAVKAQGIIPYSQVNIAGRAFGAGAVWVDQVLGELDPKIDLDKDGVPNEKEWYLAVKKGVFSFDDPQWQCAIQVLRDFSQKYYTPGWEASSWPRSKEDFITHKAAVFDDSSWFATDTASPEQRGFDWEPFVQHRVSLTKDGPCGQYVDRPARSTIRIGFAFAVPAGKPNEKQIIDFLQYITAPKTASAIADQTLLLMPLKTITMKHPLSRFLEEPRNPPLWWSPFPGLTPEFWTDASNLLYDYMLGRIEMDKMVSGLKKAAETAIKDIEEKHPDWAKEAQ